MSKKMDGNSFLKRMSWNCTTSTRMNHVPRWCDWKWTCRAFVYVSLSQQIQKMYDSSRVLEDCMLEVCSYQTPRDELLEWRSPSPSLVSNLKQKTIPPRSLSNASTMLNLPSDLSSAWIWKAFTKSECIQCKSLATELADQQQRLSQLEMENASLRLQYQQWVRLFQKAQSYNLGRGKRKSTSGKTSRI